MVSRDRADFHSNSFEKLQHDSAKFIGNQVMRKVSCNSVTSSPYSYFQVLIPNPRPH